MSSQPGELAAGRSARPRPAPARFFAEPVAAKVPEITLWFWVVKILTTAGGEVTSDSLKTLGNVMGGGIEVLLFVVGLVLQFRSRRYSAIAYWFLAYAIAIFGTGIADFMHLDVGIPYAGTTIIWAVVLAAVFLTWHRSEGTLSIHSITTQRRELFYWATVFATFALGTALGDFTATALGLGYLASGVLFGVLILVPAAAWRWAHLDEVAAFWCAYVLTRPLGASFADYFSKPHSISGLGLGNPQTAIVVALVVFALVVYLAVARPDVQTSVLAGDVGARRSRRGPSRGGRLVTSGSASTSKQWSKEGSMHRRHVGGWPPPAASGTNSGNNSGTDDGVDAVAPLPRQARVPPAPVAQNPGVGQVDRPIEQFDPLLRDLLAWGLVVREGAAGATAGWRLVDDAQHRLEHLVATTRSPASDQLMYFDHVCAGCGTRQLTHLVDGKYLCDGCRERRREPRPTSSG